MQPTINKHKELARLGHLWVEVTNGCNLKCNHCYSDSFPGSHARDRVSTDQFKDVLRQGSEFGFRSLQFIGGEPTTNKDLDILIRFAATLGYNSIEIFSNLRTLPIAVLEAVSDCNCRIATSIYSHVAAVHDRITNVPGSHLAVIRNLEALAGQNIRVRAGFVELEENRGHFAEVKNMLRAIGVHDVSSDRVRDFGRARVGKGDLAELCGACSGMTACVSHDGTVFPCIMSRMLPLGSIFESSFGEILSGIKASAARNEIQDAVSIGHALCHPSVCNPHMPECGPFTPCVPSVCHPYQPGASVAVRGMG